MILVIGGSGMLGAYLLKELDNKGLKYEAPVRKQLDLSSIESVKLYLANGSYKVILHLAAETDVDLCERDPRKAYTVNVLATEELAKYAREKNIPIVFISTSAVFGAAEKLKYSEIDMPLPLNLYGSSKLLGEQAIQRLCTKYLIIRAAWMVGGGPERDNKFISKILPALKNNNPVMAAGDKWGTLTYAKDLAVFIVNACNRELTGVMHFASVDACTRFEIAKFAAETIGSNSKLTMVDSSMFPLSAPRPISEALYSLSPEMVGGSLWKEIITDYLKEWL